MFISGVYVPLIHFNVLSEYRAETAETVRLATVVSPLVTFNFVSAWLQALLQKPIHTGEVPFHLNLISNCTAHSLRKIAFVYGFELTAYAYMHYPILYLLMHKHLSL